MDRKDLAAAADPAVMGRYLAGLPQAGHAHAGPSESVRTDDYSGHKIVVKSTYDVSIDGTPLPLHLSVANDGTVHCHSLPNYTSGSLMDVLRRLIDAFPNDFPPGGPKGGGAGGTPGGGHGMGGMGGTGGTDGTGTTGGGK